MQPHFKSSLLLSLCSMLLCMGLYTTVLLGIARLAPGQGKGISIESGSRAYYANIGQRFDQDRYFWSRPSATSYNAAGSAGSNKGPSNPEYLAQVQARIDTFLLHNPGVSKQQIPAEMVTASGSGLDPDLSPQAARIQVPRVARARALPESKVLNLVEQHIQGPLWGIFGPSKVNVLALNLALDELR